MFHGLMVGTPQPSALPMALVAMVMTSGLVPSPVKAAMPAWAQEDTRMSL